MSYIRPTIDPPVMRDGDGQVIDYGKRWGNESPPEDTYSVDTHPERFAPMHTVADSLIAYLRETYDVQISEDEQVVADLLRPVTGVLRAVRVEPRDPACAALTFVFTEYPGIVMHAGLLHDFFYPVCGCDACDSTWDAEADELERVTFAIVGGHYRETIQSGHRPDRRWVLYALTYPEGEASGRSVASHIATERLEAAQPILRSLPNGWSAWPLASSAA